MEQLVSLCAVWEATAGPSQPPQLLVNMFEPSLLPVEVALYQRLVPGRPSVTGSGWGPGGAHPALSADPSKQDTVGEDSKVEGVFEGLQEALVVHNLQETLCQNRKIGNWHILPTPSSFGTEEHKDRAINAAIHTMRENKRKGTRDNIQNSTVNGQPITGF